MTFQMISCLFPTFTFSIKITLSYKEKNALAKLMTVSESANLSIIILLGCKFSNSATVHICPRILAIKYTCEY